MPEDNQNSEGAGEESQRDSQQRRARPLAKTVKRMDCPSVMREHFWSIPNNGWVECLWCFERRRTDGGKPSAGGNVSSSAATPGERSTDVR
jgi:hypothetical protein